MVNFNRRGAALFLALIFIPLAAAEPAPLTALVAHVNTSLWSSYYEKGDQSVTVIFAAKTNSLTADGKPAPFAISDVQLADEFFDAHPEFEFTHNGFNSDYDDDANFVEIYLSFMVPGNFSVLPPLTMDLTAYYPDQFREAVWENPAAEIGQTRVAGEWKITLDKIETKGKKHQKTFVTFTAVGTPAKTNTPRDWSLRNPAQALSAWDTGEKTLSPEAQKFDSKSSLGYDQEITGQLILEFNGAIGATGATGAEAHGANKAPASSSRLTLKLPTAERTEIVRVATPEVSLPKLPFPLRRETPGEWSKPTVQVGDTNLTLTGFSAEASPFRREFHLTSAMPLPPDTVVIGDTTDKRKKLEWTLTSVESQPRSLPLAVRYQPTTGAINFTLKALKLGSETLPDAPFKLTGKLPPLIKIKKKHIVDLPLEWLEKDKVKLPVEKDGVKLVNCERTGNGCRLEWEVDLDGLPTENRLVLMETIISLNNRGKPSLYDYYRKLRNNRLTIRTQYEFGDDAAPRPEIFSVRWATEVEITEPEFTLENIPPMFLREYVNKPRELF